jgi:hypothetical protein
VKSKGLLADILVLAAGTFRGKGIFERFSLTLMVQRSIVSSNRGLHMKRVWCYSTRLTEREDPIVLLPRRHDGRIETARKGGILLSDCGVAVDAVYVTPVFGGIVEAGADG